ncbi:MAG TPA: thiolase family protein [Dehalococcoidia bacterium]|nr:thiolase family protein [Dehalococcoidia bacterium]
MTLRGKAAIVGFYEIPTEKEMPDRSTSSVLAEVARGAILDAGLRIEDIDGVIGQEALNSLTMNETLGLKPRYTSSMTTHGASGATSIVTAASVIAAGLADYVLCVFGESRQRSSSRLNAVSAAQRVAPTNRASEWETPFGPVIAANGGYGLIKERHMYEYGTTQEQFAKCAVDERFNALENPNAVWQGQPITIDDVLNSRFTNDPLHLLESVMPCSGGAAVVVTSAERARSMPHPPAYVLGAGGPATSHDTIWQEDRIATTPVVMTAPNALQMAEVNINDIEFAEFYDCYTILVMACLEDAGICAKGDIGAFYESTDTTYKGEFPINTDGGQIAAGQPGGSAGGFRHIVEATRQVMGRAENRQVEKSDLCLVNG